MIIAPAPTRPAGVQLAAPTGSPVVAVPAPDLLPNISVHRTIDGPQPGMTIKYSTFVQFDGKLTYGGNASATVRVDGEVAGFQFRAFRKFPKERAAAAALLDAVRGSGLLQMDFTPRDKTMAEVGRGRIYLDRGSRYLEYDLSAPPAQVSAVLTALDAYHAASRFRPPAFGAAA